MRSDLQSDTSSSFRTYEELVRSVLREAPSDKDTESTYQQSSLALRGEFKRDSFLLEAVRSEHRTRKFIACVNALTQVGKWLAWTLGTVVALGSTGAQNTLAQLANRDGAKSVPMPTPSAPPTASAPDPGQASIPIIKSSLRT